MQLPTLAQIPQKLRRYSNAPKMSRTSKMKNSVSHQPKVFTNTLPKDSQFKKERKSMETSFGAIKNKLVKAKQIKVVPSVASSKFAVSRHKVNLANMTMDNGNAKNKRRYFELPEDSGN